ncbi:MAG: hypothetical protein KZQ77_15050 [Candidatus Thiodiazotropha sp. (ex Notomyrtea botanica)]|nr:hypothetical protein [Candidatus Thiodiazotropha sp. (ex Notomyrtea botanica)]
MGGIPLDQWSGSGATKELEKTVVSLSEASERQTRHIIKLTYAMLILTFVMACMVAVQIYIALQQQDKIEQTKISPASVSNNIPLKNKAEAHTSSQPKRNDKK